MCTTTFYLWIRKCRKCIGLCTCMLSGFNILQFFVSRMCYTIYTIFSSSVRQEGTISHRQPVYPLRLRYARKSPESRSQITKWKNNFDFLAHINNSNEYCMGNSAEDSLFLCVGFSFTLTSSCLHIVSRVSLLTCRLFTLVSPLLSCNSSFSSLF